MTPQHKTSSLTAFGALIRRDLTIAYRNRGELANPLLFFVMVLSLFPMAISPEASVLKMLAPGAIWVAALLATLLSLDALFRSDFDDGTLEQMLISAHPLSLLVLAKVCAHWLITGVPLLLIAPLLGILFQMPANALLALCATLLLGTPILSLIGSIGIALTVGLKRGGVLLSLLILPLYIPVLIFGAHAVDSASAGLPIEGQLLFMAAMLALALTLAPLAAAAALRISLS